MIVAVRRKVAMQGVWMLIIGGLLMLVWSWIQGPQPTEMDKYHAYQRMKAAERARQNSVPEQKQ